MQFGKKIESNVIQSLELADISLNRSADLDHNHKIDFMLIIMGEPVGVQFSIKRDEIKAKAAKACALRIVTRFIYLSIIPDFFKQPCKDKGKELYNFLSTVVKQNSNKALSIYIGKAGTQVRAT